MLIEISQHLRTRCMGGCRVSCHHYSCLDSGAAHHGQRGEIDYKA